MYLDTAQRCTSVLQTRVPTEGFAAVLSRRGAFARCCCNRSQGKSGAECCAGAVPVIAQKAAQPVGDPSKVSHWKSLLFCGSLIVSL
jgi:hypothetical protein